MENYFQNGLEGRGEAGSAPAHLKQNFYNGNLYLVIPLIKIHEKGQCFGETNLLSR